MKRSVRSEWRAVVLVCRKCTRKAGGGFGAKGNTPLAKALRKWAGGAKGRKAHAGIVEVPCLKLCPKHAVTVVDAARPGEWLIVETGTPVAAVAARLGMVARLAPDPTTSPRRRPGPMSLSTSMPAWTADDMDPGLRRDDGADQTA